MSLRAWLIGALLMLQGADVVLTWRLLSSQADVVEANPVAVAVLDSHGWSGAVALKVACTAVALGCVLHIWRTRPGVGGGLLGGLCAVMLTVVCYSGALLARPSAGDQGEVAVAAKSAALDEQWANLRELAGARNRICAELLAGRVGLPEAVRQMSEWLSRHRGGLTDAARPSWPRPEDSDQVAQFLIRHCGAGPVTQARAEALRGLHEQFALGHTGWAPPAEGPEGLGMGAVEPGAARAE